MHYPIKQRKRGIVMAKEIKAFELTEEEIAVATAKGWTVEIV